MDVREAVSSRYSCRAFLAKPVPLNVVQEIVAQAARAPSAGNVQPWRIYALAGKPLEALRTNLAAREAELPRGEGGNYRIFPDPMEEPYRSRRFEVGEMLYRSIGVPRENKAARYRQYARNFQLFGAPVALFFALQKSFGVAQWADIGGYLQTVALLARAYGLHTCPQQAWVSFHQTVRDVLALPPDMMVYSGMALGYEDETAPINGWRAPRVGLSEYATFSGFD
ncbi:MAG TPA: nitroreductase [Bradyrhizobium sp.]|jgi:nitroreductase|nr:nitroreductase [Bradyrhizobium sp.]